DLRAARRDDHRLAEAGDVLQQRRALQVARGDLVGRNAERLEEVGAGEVEGGGEEVDAELRGIRLQLAVLVQSELEELAVFAVCGAEAVLVVVRLLVGGARIEAAVVALLQLYRVRPRQLGLAKELTRLVQAALVVVADFRDDVAGRVIADLVRADSEGACHLSTPGHRPAGAAGRPDSGFKKRTDSQFTSRGRTSAPQTCLCL